MAHRQDIPGRPSRPEPALQIGMLVTQREAIAPDLWRVVDLEGRIATLEPISLGTTRQQSPVGDLRRYRIKTTDQVFRGEELVRVVRLANPRSDDLYEYDVEGENGAKGRVRELELKVTVGSAAPDIVAMMQNLDAAPAPLACARADLLHAYFDATVKSLGIVGYNGARMLPIPHQIAAARYALLFGRTRFLLADEVGLGKTVEAGLIVSTLRKYFPAWKTALFVPESLTVQWAFEMYGKFGKAIFRLDQESELFDDEEDEDDPGMILPHARAIKWAATRKPEILVVDEAHQVLRDASLCDAFVKLSRNAHAVLLLTATPSSGDGGNLDKLFRMVDPEYYELFRYEKQLNTLLARQGDVEDFLAALRDPESDGTEIVRRWEAVGIEDNELTARVLSLKINPRETMVRAKLAAVVTDRYYPRARILRYQRKFLARDYEMPERVEEPVEYSASRQELAVRGVVRRWLDLAHEQGHADHTDYQDIAAILVHASHSSPLAVQQWCEARRGKLETHGGVTADPIHRSRELLATLELLRGEDDVLEDLEYEAARWAREAKAVDVKGRQLARLARYEAMLRQLLELAKREDEPLRALIFTSFECNVKPLYLLLNKGLGEDVEVFSISAEMEWRERERSAFAFQECRGPCVLISDELGGEGRNFQFANVLFHFDLPLASWVLEQRIGRLDRVGRDPDLDVDSQVLVASEQLDEAIYEFQREGVNVFNESLAHVEDSVEGLSRRLVRACIAGGAEGVRELVEPVAAELEKRREREEIGLLTRRDTGFEDVKRLVPQLHDDEELKRLGKAVSTYTRLLGSVVDHHAGKTTLTVGMHHPLHAVTGVLSEMQGYFNRREAVRHERLEFFSAGHPFVRSLARMALQESHDRVAFLARAGAPQPAFVFSCRIFLPQGFLGAIREMPSDLQPALLCSAGHNFPTRMLRLMVDFDGNLLPEGPETAALLQPWQRGETSMDEGSEILAHLPLEWEKLTAHAAQTALEETRRLAGEHLAAHIGALQAHLSEVLTRHFGSDFPVEGQIDTLLFEIDPLSIEIDSVTVVFPPT